MRYATKKEGRGDQPQNIPEIAHYISPLQFGQAAPKARTLGINPIIENHRVTVLVPGHLARNGHPARRSIVTTKIQQKTRMSPSNYVINDL